MKRSTSMALAVLIASAALIGNAFAGSAPVTGAPGGNKTNSEHSSRADLTFTIVKKWGAHVQEAYSVSPSQWAKEMIPLFRASSMDAMQRAANATNFDAMNDILLNTKSKTPSKTLGEIANDLVFVPITPCRLFDTRLAGGIITAGSTRSFDVAAVTDYSFQGGSASNCGGAGAAGSFAAAAINFTVVSTAGQGYITAYPFLGTQPLAATMVFVGGDLLSNLSVVRLDQGASANELSVFASNQTHLVGDIVGYYKAPAATALQCVDTLNTSEPVAAGATANAVAPACATGYTPTTTNCQSSVWEMPLVFSSGGTCSAKNNGAASATLRASRTCCRVPGI